MPDIHILNLLIHGLTSSTISLFKMESLDEYLTVQNRSHKPEVDIQRKDIKLKFDNVISYSSFFDINPDGLGCFIHY